MEQRYLDHARRCSLLFPALYEYLEVWRGNWELVGKEGGKLGGVGYTIMLWTPYNTFFCAVDASIAAFMFLAQLSLLLLPSLSALAFAIACFFL